MFAAWQAPVARPTMDIDLLGITDNGVDAIVAVARDICVQEVEADGLVFDPDSVGGERSDNQSLTLRQTSLVSLDRLCKKSIIVSKLRQICQKGR